MHKKNGDKRATMRATEDRGDSSAARVAFYGRALKVVIALIALAAVAASVPALSRADFPLASLLIYTIGMGFIAMPLCLYHELLLKRRMHGA
ncbi:MAG: hypothetical protein JSS14_04175 [Proteobacteria bacterium]|nr:hypothetical protein [Pseudomonadota bacterium]